MKIMASDQSKKRFRNHCIDRISTMPDSILSKILSYLPIKIAIATSILSTRWKNLFPFGEFPIKIHLINTSFRPSPNFTKFVDKLLNETLHNGPSVKKILLHCHDKYVDDKIVSWICAALRLNVVHLGLSFKLNDSNALFHNLNGCTSLVKLELGEAYLVSFPKEFVLPNLKRLWLYSLLFCDDDKSIQDFINGCPMVEDLLFNKCLLGNIANLYIKSLLLKKLRMRRCMTTKLCEIAIDAPNLEVFGYDIGNILMNCVLTDCKSLVSVQIEFDFYVETPLRYSIGSRMAKILQECSDTIELYLYGNVIKALQHASVQLPTFQNLISLTLGRMQSSGGSTILAYLLQSAPKLQTLVAEKGFDMCEESCARLMESLSLPPVCVELHLKKIDIRKFKGEENEMKLIEYFLRNGRVLQEVKVHSHLCENRSGSVLDRIHKFYKLSKMCQIIIFRIPNKLF